VSDLDLIDVFYQDKTGAKTHTLVCHSTPGVKHMHWLRHPDGEYEGGVEAPQD
jgi:hypothetical protein